MPEPLALSSYALASRQLCRNCHLFEAAVCYDPGYLVSALGNTCSGCAGLIAITVLYCCVEPTAMMDILGVVLMIVGAGLVFSYLDVTIGSSSND
jgi:predicted acyltransferase